MCARFAKPHSVARRVERPIVACGGTFYTILAQARLEELKDKQTAVSRPQTQDTVVVPPATSPAAGSQTQATSPSASKTSIVGNYDIEKLSSVNGQLLATSHIPSFDASRPDSGVETCAQRCDATHGCKAFDVSLIYNKCSLYGSVDRKGSMGGYISGVKRVQ